MAVIQRPPKEGAATTYQGKVAAGYTKILASEVDADLDTIYAAWNAGVDTVNIKPGAITGAQLAPGAVGTRELADGGVYLVDLNAEVKAAGGDLAGQYPNPTVVKVSGGNLSVVPRGGIYAGDPGGVFQLFANSPGSVSYDASKPAWIIRMNYGADLVELWRAPPGTSSWVPLFSVNNAGKITTGGATVGARQHVAPPTPWSTSTYNTPVLVCTLPAITTRGGAVLLTMNHSLYYSSSAVTGNGTIYVMIYRNGAQLTNAIHGQNYGSGGGQIVVPVPPLVWLDTPPAGTYTYDLRVQLSNTTSPSLTTMGYGDNVAQEIG